MTVVVNLFAGPGAGKSTTAHGLMYAMKRQGMSCEASLEYAKDVVWEGRLHLLEDQIYIFAKQHKRLRNLDGKVDFVITDSPLLLSSIYGHAYPQWFHDMVQNTFSGFYNLNVMIERTKPYIAIGRLQTKDQAVVLDENIRRLLDALGVPFVSVHGDEHAVGTILEMARTMGEREWR